MNLSKLREIVKDREAAVHGVAKSKHVLATEQQLYRNRNVVLFLYVFFDLSGAA